MISDILDVDRIEERINTSIVGKRILVYKCTSSTNDIAWEYAKGRNNSGLCVFAEEQTAGRGRRQNKWLSPEGESVLCSMLLCEFPVEAELLTLASAVAAAEAIGKFVESVPAVKWPNDIMINGKKTAGILVESRSSNGLNDFVIGIGINCRQQGNFFQNNQLQMPATSIDLESRETVDRNKLAAELIKSFDDWLNLARDDNTCVIDRWRQLSSQLGTHITVQFDQKHFSGNCIGVDPVKGLILHLDDGLVRMFDAAHTTIVKQNL